MEKKKKPPRRKIDLKDGWIGSYVTKKNESLISQVLKTIEKGMIINQACLVHDLDVTSWYRWRQCKDLKKDEFDDQGMELTKDERRCWECSGCRLQKRADSARSRFVLRHVEKVNSATIHGEDVWTASAWLLERTSPNEFGSRTKQEITHTLNAGNANAQKLVAAIIAAAVKGE